jgi:hypothetical protein
MRENQCILSKVVTETKGAKPNCSWCLFGIMLQLLNTLYNVLNLGSYRDLTWYRRWLIYLAVCWSSRTLEMIASFVILCNQGNPSLISTMNR